MPKADSSQSAPGIHASPNPVFPPSRAWQPITPRGVAAFSRAPLNRLLLAQLLVAALTAGAICWFLNAAWFPVVRQAIARLPDSGGITNAILSFPQVDTEPLAGNRFLALVIDPDGRTGADAPTDILVTFGRGRWQACSLFGCLTRPYEQGWIVSFTRLEVEAAWGAWRTTVLIVAAAGMMLTLFASWFVLATIACPLVRLYAFFKDREVTLPGSWKLAGASLLPGGLIMVALIVSYGLGAIDLVRFLIGWLVHIPVALVYLITAPLQLPRSGDTRSTSTNPFANSPSDLKEGPPPSTQA